MLTQQGRSSDGVCALRLCFSGVCKRGFANGTRVMGNQPAALPECFFTGIDTRQPRPGTPKLDPDRGGGYLFFTRQVRRTEMMVQAR